MRWVARVLRGETVVDPGTVYELSEAVAAIRRGVAVVADAGCEPDDDPGVLVAKLEATGHAPQTPLVEAAAPEPVTEEPRPDDDTAAVPAASEPFSDPAAVHDFILESSEGLEQLDTDLVALEKRPEQRVHRSIRLRKDAMKLYQTTLNR